MLALIRLRILQECRRLWMLIMKGMAARGLERTDRQRRRGYSSIGSCAVRMEHCTIILRSEHE